MKTMFHPLRTTALAAVALAALVAPSGLAAAATNHPEQPAELPDPQQLTPGGLDGRFVRLTPRRLFDTRNNNDTVVQVPIRRLTAADELRVDLGATGLFDTGHVVQAVALNLTAVNAEIGGHVTAYECDTPVPTSNLNVQPGNALANSAIVSLPRGVNKVCFRASSTMDLAVDITGYFAETYDEQNTYVPISPQRILDTRGYGNGLLNIPVGQPTPDSVITVPISSLALYRPGETPSAIDLRVTTAGARSRGYVTAYPCAQGAPGTSTVNLSTSEALTNSSIIPVDAAGNICLKVAGQTDVIVDMTGYFVAGSAGYTYFPMTPVRAYDTRQGFPSIFPSIGALNYDTIALFDFRGLNYPGGTPVALTTNVTSLNATGVGHLRAWPADVASTSTSINNYPGGPRARASSSILGLARSGSTTGMIAVATTRDTDMIIDVSGYFAA